MPVLSERQDTMIKSSSASIMKAIMPYLADSSLGSHVKGFIDDELWRCVVTMNCEKFGGFIPTLIAAIVAGLVGLAIGQFAN